MKHGRHTLTTSGVLVEIVKRWISHCDKADPNYGIGLATRTGLQTSDLPGSLAAE